MIEQKIKYLKDYKKPDFLIKETHLSFEVLADKIIVSSHLLLNKNNAEAKDLVLDGDELKTIKVILNDKILKEEKDYIITPNTLTIKNIPEKATVKTIVEIDPFNNTKLMGIYKTNTGLASQCEPEGFRRITWFIDRPDVMSLFFVDITADKTLYPTLLSNGNMVENKTSSNLNICSFVDPFPKPSYLFAFVAGDFDLCSSTFTTKSGKKVATNVFVEKGKQDQGYFALESLHKSMKWDEDTYNLEYDLDIFSIVAVSDFNFGAMENKSLNIFNDAYVLANPYIATDDDYFNIESIVAHEYFHNYTGDRITCRDWFQLTLKEGLTVYRDHKFSMDLHNKDTVRIAQVETLRNFQFAEDASPLAHPIRPKSYIEMNNFYTTTVYEKGCEIIKMIEVLIGEENFKKGISTYFANFDGQAVTCEEFVWSMEKASGISLEKFKRWYEQSGTPVVSIEDSYNEAHKTYTLNITQTNTPTKNEPHKTDLVIPLKTALFNKSGMQMDLKVAGKSLGKDFVVILDEGTKEVVFENVTEKPTLSTNRGFSAPVIINYKQDDADKINLIENDTDGFARFEASQTYLKKHMLKWVAELQSGKNIVDAEVTNILLPYVKVLDDYAKDHALTNVLLRLPTFNSLEGAFSKNLPVEEIYTVIFMVEKALAKLLEPKLLDLFNKLQDLEEFSAKMMAIRSLKHRCLYYLLKLEKQKYLTLVENYYKTSKSMTKKIASLVAIKDLYNTKEHKYIYESFYDEFKSYHTVLNKWFNLSAGVLRADGLENIKALMELDSFSIKNPNKLRNLMAGFMSNYKVFHNLDGSGYKFLEEIILKLDLINPSISANLAKSFAKINLHNSKRQALMKASMENILQHKNISKGLYEIISKILDIKE
jgi:aminopeptidase N